MPQAETMTRIGFNLYKYSYRLCRVGATCAAALNHLKVQKGKPHLGRLAKLKIKDEKYRPMAKCINNVLSIKSAWLFQIVLRINV